MNKAPDCDNCVHSYYSPEDKGEYQKCKIRALVRKKMRVRTNMRVFRLMRESGLGDVCEYHDFK